MHSWTQRAWSLLATLALLTAVTLVGTEDLKAQANSWPPAFPRIVGYHG